MVATHTTTINVNYSNGNNAGQILTKVSKNFEECVPLSNVDYLDGELLSYYNNLGDDSKIKIQEIGESVKNLGDLLLSCLNEYQLIDDDSAKELESLIGDLFGNSDTISDMWSPKLNEETQEKANRVKEKIFKKLGIDEDSEDGKKLSKDIDNFIKYNEPTSVICVDEHGKYLTNIAELEFFESKIPDNYKDYANNCNWDSEPNKVIRYEGCSNTCQWFDVDGLNVRMTSVIDGDNPYPALQQEFNRVYCYNIVNEMKSWDSNYLDILKKRKYIDVIVPDGVNTTGAAFYAPGNPYCDHILLPTKLSGNIYSDESTYNYLSECLVHEMSHYLDNIVGMCQLVEYKSNDVSQEDKDFYNKVCSLINDKMYGIQLINKHGNLSPEEEENFKNYNVTPGSNFSESFAELMRADLVDKDKFKVLLGDDNYNELFSKLKSMDRRSQDGFDYDVDIKGDNKEVTIYRINGDYKEEINYKDSYELYDKKGRVTERFDGEKFYNNEYNDSNQLIKQTIMDAGGKVIRSLNNEYITKEVDGKKLYVIKETTSDNMLYEKTFTNDQLTHYKEVNGNSGRTLDIDFDNGNPIKRTVLDRDGTRTNIDYGNDGSTSETVYNPNGNVILTNNTSIDGISIGKVYYDDGSVKILDERYPDGNKFCYYLKQDGKIDYLEREYATGDKIRIYYDSEGKEINVINI